MLNLTIDNLKAFFNDRPSLSIRGIEREAGLPVSKLKEVLRGKQRLNSLQSQDLSDVLQKYGWTQPRGLQALLGSDYTPMGVPVKNQIIPNVG